MTDETPPTVAAEAPFQELTPIQDAPIAPAHGIAAVALNMAMKYHDMNLVKDGVLYQQYKMEGKNFKTLHLDEVFETAIRIERHLLASSQRIAAIVVDAITADVEESGDEQSNSEGSAHSEVPPEGGEGQAQGTPPNGLP